MANVTVYATEFDIISPGVVENPSELVRQALDAMNPVRPGRYMVTLHDSRPAYRQVHSSQLGPAFFQLIREHVPEPYFSGFLRISTPNDFSLDALIDFLNGDLCITYQTSNGRHIKINRQDSRTLSGLFPISKTGRGSCVKTSES